MTFRHRILLDRLLAVPLAVTINSLVRLLGKILRRNHSFNPETTREIVVCKLVGMGSILQATPLFRALKRQFPQARLTVLTLQANASLVSRLDGVDETLCLDDSGTLSMLWTTVMVLGKLIVRHVDHFCDLEVYSGFSCLLSVFSLARNRLGFYRHSNRFKKGIYTQLVYFNTRMPVRRLYLQLGRTAGVSSDAIDSLGSIRVESSERIALQKKLADMALQGPYLLVNPNASDLLIERRWPKRYFSESIRRIAEKGHNVVLVGSKSEAVYVGSLLEDIPHPLQSRVFNTAGLLSLGELFALIEGAMCVLTNDTGPMHMAFALRKPIVCLFGPCDPGHYGLDGPKIVTLYAPVSCSPCIHEVDEPPCHGHNVCMQRLSPQLVIDSVFSVLDRDQQNPATWSQANGNGSIRLPLQWDNECGKPLGTVIRESSVYPPGS